MYAKFQQLLQSLSNNEEPIETENTNTESTENVNDVAEDVMETMEKSSKAVRMRNGKPVDAHDNNSKNRQEKSKSIVRFYLQIFHWFQIF